MKILILGDIHAEWMAMEDVIRNAMQECPEIEKIIQLGDLGEKLVLGKDYLIYKPRNVPQHLLPILAIDGNHDNHDLLTREGDWGNPAFKYIKRGEVFTINGIRFMGMGGAHSIDRDMRTEGVDWYRGELITYGQITKALTQGEVDIMLSHERPSAFGNPRPNYWSVQEADAQRWMLNELLELKPKLWFHGHHHVKVEGITSEVKHQGLADILDKNGSYAVLDIAYLEK